MKRTLIYIMRTKIRRYSVPCLTSAGRVCIRRLKFFAVLCVSRNDCVSAVSIEFGDKDKF